MSSVQPSIVEAVYSIAMFTLYINCLYLHRIIEVMVLWSPAVIQSETDVDDGLMDLMVMVSRSMMK